MTGARPKHSDTLEDKAENFVDRELVVDIKDLAISPKVKDISMKAYKGEIIGIGGLERHIPFTFQISGKHQSLLGSEPSGCSLSEKRHTHIFGDSAGFVVFQNYSMNLYHSVYYHFVFPAAVSQKHTVAVVSNKNPLKQISRNIV